MNRNETPSGDRYDDIEADLNLTLGDLTCAMEIRSRLDNIRREGGPNDPRIALLMRQLPRGQELPTYPEPVRGIPSPNQRP